MKRLRKLEGIVEELSGQIEVDGGRHSSAGDSPETIAGHDGEAAGGNCEGSTYGSDGAGRGSPAGGGGRFVSGQHATHGPARNMSDSNKQLGRLVHAGKGLTRYVSSGFWSKINDEVGRPLMTPVTKLN